MAQLAHCGTCIETLEAICKVYAERTAFGFCPPGEADWRTLTYQQFWLRVQAFAAGRHLHAPALATAQLLVAPLGVQCGVEQPLCTARRGKYDPSSSRPLFDSSMLDAPGCVHQWGLAGGCLTVLTIADLRP